MKKDPWIPIYRDKAKTQEAWCTTDGSDIIENNRTESQGPSNKAYKVAQDVKVIPVSDKYRDHYSDIKWDGDEDKKEDQEVEMKNVVGFY